MTRCLRHGWESTNSTDHCHPERSTLGGPADLSPWGKRSKGSVLTRLNSDMNLATSQVRVQLPYHLRNLAHIDGEVALEVTPPVTVRAVLDALEASYPMLRGTIRDHDTLARRPFLRFFACEQDLSLDSPDNPLPDAIARGKEPLLIIGAIAGGSPDS